MPTGAMNQVEHEAMGHAFKAAFPDSYMAVEKIVESGDDLVVLGYFRGTQSGDLQSPGGRIPASGNQLNLRFMDYFKVDGDRIVDHETIFRPNGDAWSAWCATARLAVPNTNLGVSARMPCHS